MGYKTKPRQCERWMVWSGSYPMMVAYTRKQAIRDFLQNIGPRYTWEQLVESGYSVCKVIIKPKEKTTNG